MIYIYKFKFNKIIYYNVSLLIDYEQQCYIIEVRDLIHYIYWNNITGIKRKLLPLSSMIYSNIKELIYIECNNQYYELIINQENIYNFLYGDNNQNGLIKSYPNLINIINNGLPSWTMWVSPLLNYKRRKCIEYIIIISNISLFLWTIYQIFKSFPIFFNLIHSLLHPILLNIGLFINPIIDKIYYIITLFNFDFIFIKLSTLILSYITHILNITIKYLYCDFINDICSKIYNNYKIIKKFIKFNNNISITQNKNLYHKFKQIIDFLWISLIKPFKHLYDFCKFIIRYLGTWIYNKISNNNNIVENQGITK